ncbi:lamin tail domain-containing protein [Longimicrobium sp.]|uniref:lamin tail domain-containing protein n=1 Tax=Longimicrobium sp. TaxID=2029185 RepID=UPI002C7DD834|nr:lamin tail domain-containing protein [Longimicrobium sp.]HSU15337.1 lamin tail domain-containing protein [Longimicrobium sp.]
MLRSTRSKLLSLGALLAFGVAACDTPSAVPARSPAPSAPRAVVIPAQGTAATLDIGNWNLEWFGDASNGPSNDALQLQNAQDVITGSDLDVWGLVEIVDATEWNALKTLSGYTGILANDAAVTGGSTWYTATEQKPALLWKTAAASLVSAKVILTANDNDFAGRPPLEVKLHVTLNGGSEDIVFIVLHMKAFNDVASWQRRQNAAVALKSYLDATYPTQKVIVVGDWNDDVDTSITAGQPSPYANFVADAARYSFPTTALTNAGIASTVSFTDMIDHQLETNELAATYVAGSVKVYRVDSYISSYGTTTSDHYPVLSRYTYGGSAPSLTVTSPNGGESWAGGSSHAITWTASGIANVKIDYTLDGGTTWTAVTSSTSAAAGSFTWTVPATASTNAKVRVTDTGSATSDASNAAFTITASTTPAKVIINEILANEAGSDVNGEFVEIVNVGGTAASIGGWTISDATGVRHTFAAGTSLAAGKAIVVYAAASAIPAGVTNAVGSSTGALSLANGGDSVILKNGGTTIDSFAYSSSLAGTDGVSMNRSPDASATGTFVLHTSISSLASSPGKHANGTAF